MYQNGIAVIKIQIVKSPVALTKLLDCIFSFVANHSSRQRLAAEYKEGLHGVVVLKTLQEWIGEQSSNATFKNLIVLLRQHDLINLCGKQLFFMLF